MAAAKTILQKRLTNVIVINFGAEKNANSPSIDVVLPRASTEVLARIIQAWMKDMNAFALIDTAERIVRSILGRWSNSATIVISTRPAAVMTPTVSTAEALTILTKV